MKKLILIAVAIITMIIMCSGNVYAMPKGITSKNYDSYIKPISDTYGFNKGEANVKYHAGEEYFYNKHYDHWNVEKVYDNSVVTSRKLAKAYAKANYPKCKVVFVKMNDKRIDNRKGKKTVYIEKLVSKSKGNYGYTIKEHYYIKYNRKVKKGNKVVSYLLWNPYTNYIDDVVAVADCKMIR